MTCPLAHDDAAYVLGALSPADRLAFERHLGGCSDCTRAVRELAGLPGLLGRVEAGLLEAGPSVEPVPDTLLPRLTRAARRDRRRRTLIAVGGAAAAAVLALVAGSQLGLADRALEALPNDDDTSPASVMDPVGDVPVRARLALQEVAWGTRLDLTCTYRADALERPLPSSVDYVLVVRTRDGRTERVGSWRSLDGKTMQLTAGTAATPEQISAVQVRTPDGRVVLTSRG